MFRLFRPSGNIENSDKGQYHDKRQIANHSLRYSGKLLWNSGNGIVRFSAKTGAGAENGASLLFCLPRHAAGHFFMENISNARFLLCRYRMRRIRPLVVLLQESSVFCVKRNGRQSHIGFGICFDFPGRDGKFCLIRTGKVPFPEKTAE